MVLNHTRVNLSRCKEGFFAMKVAKHQHRLPREAADAPSLETFKVRLDKALSSLAWLKMSPLIAAGWTKWPLNVSSK